jgi:hypothetical protein
MKLKNKNWNIASRFSSYTIVGHSKNSSSDWEQKSTECNKLGHM